MNWFLNSSSCARAPRPGVSANLSSPIVISAILPSASSPSSTYTSPPKPFFVALTFVSSEASAAGSAASAGAASSAGAAEASASFTASTTAVEVIVALAIASTFSPSVNGPVLPMNWFLNSSSCARAPKPGVSANLSSPIVISAILPSASRPSSTYTSPPKPFFVALTVFTTSAAGRAVSSAGACACSAVPASASFTASTTAVEVIVALAIASTFSPSVNGPVWPINCS